MLSDVSLGSFMEVEEIEEQDIESFGKWDSLNIHLDFF